MSKKGDAAAALAGIAVENAASSVASSACTSAAVGATIGSVCPIVGTAVGAFTGWAIKKVYNHYKNNNDDD